MSRSIHSPLPGGPPPETCAPACGPSFPASAILVCALLAGCASGGKHQRRSNVDFHCNERRASYLLTGSLAGAERGVELSCDRGGPHLESWTVADNGTRRENSKSLTAGEYEVLWAKFEATGWRNLKDCDQEGEPGGPVYSFDLKDWNGANSFACPGRELPHPYNVLVDELDLAVAGYE